MEYIIKDGMEVLNDNGRKELGIIAVNIIEFTSCLVLIKWIAIYSV